MLRTLAREFGLLRCRLMVLRFRCWRDAHRFRVPRVLERGGRPLPQRGKRCPNIEVF